MDLKWFIGYENYKSMKNIIERDLNNRAHTGKQLHAEFKILIESVEEELRRTEIEPF